ncbi:MAG: amidohydrolase family protein [Actinobacteria bacterium]|nr:MAG: amidohydrolase family protein [Actinomycetota bacterium]
MQGTVAYKAARLIDAISDDVLQDAAVVVQDGRIAWVGPAGGMPDPSHRVMDLGDATLLPGLIDAHVHLVWSASAEPHELVQRESRPLTVLRCSNNCALQLRAGVTTVRDVGATDGLSIDIARAVELGVLPGPKVVAAGRAIAMTGGHGWFLGREADGPDAVRRAVRGEIKAGATCIKFMASGGVYGHAEEPGSPQLTVREMEAGVEEAHKAGLKVAAHAYSVAAINNALDAAVDSIEHGSFLDRDTAVRMRGQGVYLVPTLSVYAAMSEKGPDLGAPEYIRRKTAEILEASRETFRLAVEVGVKIAAGTDCGAPGHPHGTLSRELELMVRYGATPMQALLYGTSAAADLLGLAEETGTLEPGKRADIIAVSGNPLEDVGALQAMRMVVRGGESVALSGDHGHIGPS